MSEEAPAQQQNANQPATKVDVQVLADRVYKLMLEDARTLTARGQQTTRGAGSKRR